MNDPDDPDDGDREDTWQSRAARWTPYQLREQHPVRSGRPPRMTIRPWSRVSRDTDMGQTRDGEYWRCRTPGCRRWSGPYTSVMDAAEDAAEHARLPHQRTPRHKKGTAQ